MENVIDFYHEALTINKNVERNEQCGRKEEKG